MTLTKDKRKGNLLGICHGNTDLVVSDGVQNSKDLAHLDKGVGVVDLQETLSERGSLP